MARRVANSKVEFIFGICRLTFYFQICAYALWLHFVIRDTWNSDVHTATRLPAIRFFQIRLLGLNHSVSAVRLLTSRMFLILTGATGTVGVGVLRHCLASPRVTRLVILSRRDFDIARLAPGLDTSKARVVIHSDYTSYSPELLRELNGAAGIIWAQGISQTEVTREYAQTHRPLRSSLTSCRAVSMFALHTTILLQPLLR